MAEARQATGEAHMNGNGHAVDETVLDEAKRIVMGGRREDYGTPERNFSTIATMWNSYLAARPGGAAEPIDNGDVALMMCLLKIARQANRPKRDNIVDLVGYAFTASMVEP